MTTQTPGAFAGLLPKPRTARQLARQLVRIQNAERSGTLNTGLSASRKFSDHAFDTEEAFYRALERETGIDRETMRRLGGVL